VAQTESATLEDPFELCTDAFGSYVPAIREVLYDRAHYSQVVKGLYQTGGRPGALVPENL